MVKVKSANDFGNKPKSRRQTIYDYISAVVTEETEKWLQAEKERALKDNKVYQSKKKELNDLRIQILRPVVNASWANIIAKGMWKPAGFPNMETLVNMLMSDDNGAMWVNGEMVAVDTLNKAVSFYAEWEKNTTKAVRTKISEEEKIYNDFKGAMGIGLFTEEECVQKVSTKYGLNADAVQKIIEKEKAK